MSRDKQAIEGGAAWVDLGVSPPRRLPEDAAAAAAYLTDALGHPVYERWTWARLMAVYGTLPGARAAKPAVCRLLLEASDAVEFWQRGRLRLLRGDEAPPIDAVVAAILKASTGRFRFAAALPPSGASEVASIEALPATLQQWLGRRGRLANPHPDTNTLGAEDDLRAVAAFLRERASGSRHTFRAYLAELERLASWAIEQNRGPYSDLTRQDLLAYRDGLAQQPSGDRKSPGAASPPGGAERFSQKSRDRALAVIASLFGFWHKTGYLLGNPAAELSSGSRARSGFHPKRFIPSALLARCDARVREMARAACANHPPEITQLRRAAIWALYRYSGARLSELEWNPRRGLPRIDADAQGWTLHVLGKGDKERSIPLPRGCAEILAQYRSARGLPFAPGFLEQVAIFHGQKRASLGARGLFDEVKAVLEEVAAEIEPMDPGGAALLRKVSPHWLRHAYARHLVVEAGVPLPAAQALLAHASANTTAAYSMTDLSRLREFVETGFAP